MSKILLTICARGGSVGIPDKNIKEVAGKPLIAYTIEHALMFTEQHPDTDIFLSTDSDKIRQVAKDYGLQTDYQRPDALATSSTGKVAVIRDALHFAENSSNMRYDFILDLDVTSPLRTKKDLEEAFEQCQNSNKLITFSVNKSHKNPYFNIVEAVGSDYRVSKSSEGFLSRQAAPKTFDINGAFYFYKRSFFDLNLESVTQTGVFDIYVMDHICHDVDTPEDLMFLEWILLNNQL